ncbi:hypothetical protein PSCSP1l_00005 [Prochlorococcus phage P-SCSP1l]|nr:hypothetical protein PSCSP1b_00005 [Prochlorococcus phage P-SCSP1b]ULF49699.1 hypothetical protein PSCSP1g_00005 [Prochlorococcus phage P-SCSP1g]ULF49779.1 hypothetical protein PSCSP1i_00005 [Prochlorococcus phage P-SCSP1i]ULF49856.1 hypothetical protein PSCSP1l_00005 [Prochlorococcus phage P-SCSP1l]ULF49896.1 hypothetical protein PSCSP1m_00005 [Prochlorococcus phage P-SCSP1m]ULF49936.1 hypothetical protein PSCSP1n_00005 [Prochlorococcus phage P-SCSP1n]
MSKEKLKPYEVVFNQVDPENPNSPVMTSKIIYGSNLTAALVKFHNETPLVDIKRVEVFSNKKSGARLKW